MNNDILHQQKWNEALLNNVMIYPKEMVARFIGRNYKGTDNSNKNALDIGFGSGRNTRVLLDYGFNVYGIDYNEECGKVASNLLLGNGYTNLKDLVIDDFTQHDWNIKFDTVLYVGLIYFRLEEYIKKDLEKLYNIMEKDGKCLINFRNKHDVLYKNGKQVAENSFILNHTVYKDLVYTFYSEQQSRALLEDMGFKIDYAEREDYYKSYQGEKELHSWDFYAISKK